jgi:3-oxoacyl-[acyl-carrier-protein] synthase II
MTEQVVITGVGMVSALGVSLDAALADMDQQRRGVSTTDVRGAKAPYAPVTDYDLGNDMAGKKVRRMDPANTYAIAAARMALESAGIGDDAGLKENCGVIVGTGYSGFSSMVEHQRAYLRDGIAQLTPIHFRNSAYNASAGIVAIELGLNGPNATVTGVDVSGEFALAYAWMLLRQGMAERVVVVGVDDLCPALLEGLHDLGFAERDCESPSEPFSRNRRGFIPGEGAGAVVQETASAAARRNQKPLGVVEGFGIYSSADSVYSYSDKGESIRRSVHLALAYAGCNLSDVDWVSSAANGTVGLDRAESDAWGGMLNASRHAIVPFKRFTGEFSASGVLRVVFGLGCLARGHLPEGIGGDPVEILMPYRGRGGAKAGDRFLHQGVGLGGNSVSILVSSPGAFRAH